MKRASTFNGTRRQFLVHSTKLAISGAALSTWPTFAALDKQQQAIEAQFGTQPINQGRVILTIPALAENGNSVSMKIDVESPMIKDDYVKSVHVFSEANPIPTMATYYFSPSSGIAHIQTRIRLSDTQNITAIAKMNDGSLWAGTTHTLVTIAACTNPWL